MTSIIARKVENSLEYIFLIVNHLIRKPGQVINIAMENIFKTFFHLITYDNQSKTNYGEFMVNLWCFYLFEGVQ